MSLSFTLSEQFELSTGGQYSWRLKDSELRFRGTGPYERLVLQRVPVTERQLAAFRAALDLLDVWHWRNNYSPQDVECEVEDGSSWSFAASFDGQECRAAGANAYPSFVDITLTTIYRERFALLIAAIYECFNIEHYVRQAQLHASREAQRPSLPA